MPLESLLQLVETLRERISSHHAALSQSEALTRYALIDPLLRELGWDTSDPAMVRPEYRSGSGSADYALLDSSGNPAVMVEAKKLGTPLRDQVLAQGINYCLMEGTNHFAVTDGSSWEIYHTHRPVPIDEKRISEFNLNDPSPTEACLNALTLWRPSVQSGSVAAGSSPLLAPEQKSSSVAAATSAIKVTSPVPHIDQALDDDGWQRLLDVSWVKGHPDPVEIRFPDNSSIAVNTWKSLMVESVRWLANSRFLTGDRCPIQAPRAKRRCLVSTDPTHPTGQPMTTPVEVNPFYVEMNQSARGCVKNTGVIIQHVGQDPADFKVRFA